MLTILRIIGSMNPSTGGPSEGIRNSIPEMEKKGVHNEVVCFDDPNASFLGKDSFPIHVLGPGWGRWNYSSKLTPWLMENFHRFDIIIVHGLWLYHSYAVYRALIKYKTQISSGKAPKLYIMPHGMLDPYFQKATGRKLKALRNWLYWKFHESHVINNAEGVLFTCEKELELARNTFHPYQPKKEINVSYGIAPPPAYTESMQSSFLSKCPTLENKPFILFISRIHQKKGVDMLVKAYTKIIKSAEVNNKITSEGDNSINSTKISKTFSIDQIPNLVIAGPGLDTPFGQNVQALVFKSNLIKNKVLFTDMLDGESKWGAFYGCEAFILPSHQENFGIAVAEALACGKPALISNQVNIWPEVANGSGFVADDTIEGTVKLLQNWIKLSNSEKKLMGKKAHQTYENFFAIEPAAMKMVEALTT